MSFPSTDVGMTLTLKLCCYVNATPQVQVARILDVENWYFERVVFPGQHLMFEAPEAAHLKIYTGATAMVLDTIACESLRVKNLEG